MTTATELIAAERQRQIDEEGYDPAHDVLHDDGALVRAAIAYAAAGIGLRVFEEKTVGLADGTALGVSFTDPFPWQPRDDRRISNSYRTLSPEERRLDLLVKAAALIAAEIDRLT